MEAQLDHGNTRSNIVKNMVAFHSFRSGVGNSLAVLGVARSLAKCGKSVLIVDSDVYGLTLSLSASFPLFQRRSRDGFLDIFECASEEVWCMATKSQIDRGQSLLDFVAQRIYSCVWEYSKGIDFLSSCRHESNIDLAEGWLNEYATALFGMKFNELSEERAKNIFDMVGVVWPAEFDGPEVVAQVLIKVMNDAFRRQDYDFVLFDTVPGYSNAGGLICRGIANKIVSITDRGWQSLVGTADMLNHIPIGKENVKVVFGKYPMSLIGSDIRDVNRIIGEGHHIVLPYDDEVSAIEITEEITSPALLDGYYAIAEWLMVESLPQSSD